MSLRVALRQMFSDCVNSANLTGKLKLLSRPEVTAFGFYAYDRCVSRNLAACWIPSRRRANTGRVRARQAPAATPGA